MLTVWSRRAIWIAAALLAVTTTYNLGQFVYRSQNRRAAAVAGPTHDFGIVFAGEIKDHVFRAKNGAPTPLTIERVNAECGCTIVKDDLEGKTFGPAQEFEVPIRWTVPDKAGEFKKAVVVYFDDHERAPLRLNLRADVKRRFAYSLEQLSMDAKAVDDVRSQTFTITRAADSPPFELSYVSTNSTMLAAKLEPAESGLADDVQAWRVTVTTVPPLRLGRHEAHIFLQADDTSLQFTPLPAVLVVRSGESAAPDQVGAHHSDRPAPHASN